MTSGDWQESDQLLAGIITDFGSPTGPVAVRRPRRVRRRDDRPVPRARASRASSAARICAPGTRSGATAARTSSSRTATSTSTTASSRLDGSEIRADGRFSLGYPRDDGGEEINARFRVVRRDLDSLRHAFELDDYSGVGPAVGRVPPDRASTSAPVGFGGDDDRRRRRVRRAVPEGDGVAALRRHRRAARRRRTSPRAAARVTGAAFVGWDATYSFNADGRRIPVEKHRASFDVSRARRCPASPSSRPAAAARSTSRATTSSSASNDLFVGEEGVGQVTGTLALRGNELSGEIDAASPRLALTGTGRIALTPQADAELTFRFHDSSLDPYVRLFVPKLSPYHDRGRERNDPRRRRARRRRSPARRRHGRHARHAPVRLRGARTRRRSGSRSISTACGSTNSQLVGDDTRLRVVGQRRPARRADRAAGDRRREPRHPAGVLPRRARLGPRRADGGDRRSAATAACSPAARRSPTAASVTSRCRTRSTRSTASIRFDARGIRLDDVTATMGGGPVQFGGRDRLRRLPAGRARTSPCAARTCTCAIPKAIRSIVDADLVAARQLQGADARRHRDGQERDVDQADRSDRRPLRFRPAASARRAAVVAATPRRACRCASTSAVLVPSTLRVENNLARLVASADLHACAAPTIGRCCSAAPRSSAARCTFEGRRYLRHARHDRLHQPDADRAVLRRRGGDATCACRARPIA